MRGLEVFLLKSLACKKAKAKPVLRKCCRIEVPGKPGFEIGGGYSTIAALPNFPSSTTYDSACEANENPITKPCFLATRHSERHTFDGKLFDLVFEVTLTDQSISTDSQADRQKHVGKSLHWTASAESVLGLSPSVRLIPQKIRPANKKTSLDWLVSEGLTETRIVVQNRQIIGYSSGSLRWMFAVDESQIRRIRVIPITSAEPIQQFWSVITYHEHLRKYDPEIHPLESLVASLWSIFQGQYLSLVSQMQVLGTLPTTERDRRVSASKRICGWLTATHTTMREFLLNPILDAVAIIVELSEYFPGFAKTLQSLGAQISQLVLAFPPHLDEEWRSLKQLVANLLSQKMAWLLRCVLQKLKKHSAELLDELWIHLHVLCPNQISETLQKNVRQMGLLNFQPCRLAACMRRMFYGESFGEDLISSKSTNPNLMPVQRSIMKESTVFDINGKVLAIRKAKSTVATPPERFMVWKGHLVFCTSNRATVKPAKIKDLPWDTRTNDSRLLARIPRTSFQIFKIAWEIILNEHKCLTFLGHNEENKECFMRRGFYPPLNMYLFHWLRLNISRRGVHLDCGTHFYNNDVKHLPIIGHDNVVHSVHSDTSSSFASVHFISHHDETDKDAYEGEFIVQLKNRNIQPQSGLKDISNLSIRRRLACPVPVNLLVPKAKRPMVNFSTWVKLSMLTTEPAKPEKFILFAYFQTVEIIKSKSGSCFSIITKVNLLQYETQPHVWIPNAWTIAKRVLFVYHLSRMPVPSLRSTEDCMVFDPEESEWVHHFLWKQLLVGMTGIRIKPTGEHIIFCFKRNRFQVVGKSRLALPPGIYQLVKPATCEPNTGRYFCKTKTSAQGLQVHTLYELAIRT